VSASSNVDIVKQGYAAFGQGDVPGILALNDANTEWTLPGASLVPWAGIYRGHDELQKFFTLLAEAVDFEAFEPRQFLGDGDTVVVIGYEKGRVKASGKAFESHWVHVHTLSGGKTTHFFEYTDTAAVAAACR
jgi:ketosteroid isomerase-like protein